MLHIPSYSMDSYGCYYHSYINNLNCSSSWISIELSSPWPNPLVPKNLGPNPLLNHYRNILKIFRMVTKNGGQFRIVRHTNNSLILILLLISPIPWYPQWRIDRLVSITKKHLTFLDNVQVSLTSLANPTTDTHTHTLRSHWMVDTTQVYNHGPSVQQSFLQRHQFQFLDKLPTHCHVHQPTWRHKPPFLSLAVTFIPKSMSRATGCVTTSGSITKRFW